MLACGFGSQVWDQFWGPVLNMGVIIDITRVFSEIRYVY